MRRVTYKTNWLLWFLLSLVCFLFWFGGLDFVRDLFSGELHIQNLLDFGLIAAFFFSVLAGWLLQCALVIIWSWKRKNPKPPQ